MVKISVSGLPKDIAEHRRLQVRAMITNQIMGLMGLGYEDTDEVDVVFPLIPPGKTADPSSVYVDVCLSEDGQADNVYGGIARLVGAEVMHQFPFQRVELFMNPFRPGACGYWSYTP